MQHRLIPYQMTQMTENDSNKPVYPTAEEALASFQNMTSEELEMLNSPYSPSPKETIDHGGSIAEVFGEVEVSGEDLEVSGEDLEVSGEDLEVSGEDFDAFFSSLGVPDVQNMPPRDISPHDSVAGAYKSDYEEKDDDTMQVDEAPGDVFSSCGLYIDFSRLAAATSAAYPTANLIRQPPIPRQTPIP